LLEISDLRISVEHGAEILHGVSFNLHKGEFIGLVGESGSGKSMIGRAIMGLLPPRIHRTQGRIMLSGDDLTALPTDRLRAKRGIDIGMVFQEPMVSLNPAMRIGDQLAEGLAFHTDLSQTDIRQKIFEILARVRIENPERVIDCYPHEFSGGMRQRIMLASVMLLKPKLLIADEPTTALDMLSQKETMDVMVSLAREVGTAVILITHNLGLVSCYTDRAIVLERGSIVESGDSRQILRQPAHAYTKRLVDSLPKRKQRPAPLPHADQPLLSVKDLTVSYKRASAPGGRISAVDSVSFDVYPGETVAIVGGSGSGKTTLGRAVLGLITQSSGKINFRGMPVFAGNKAADRNFRLSCQLVFQDPYSSLDPRMRIWDIVAEPLRHCPDLDATARKARVLETLSDVGLADFGHRLPHELSGGQRQRVAIARALVRRPDFVVADEPVSALDVTIQAQVLALLQRLQAQYQFACLFISHDLAVVDQIADRIIVMNKGVIAAQGLREDIFDRPSDPYVIQLLAAIPTPDTERSQHSA